MSPCRMPEIARPPAWDRDESVADRKALGAASGSTRPSADIDRIGMVAVRARNANPLKVH